MASSVAKSGASFESIASASGTGSSGTITFSSIPSTFTHLQIRFSAIITSGSGPAIEIYLNGDNSTNYTRHSLYGTGAAVGAASANGTTSIYAYGAFNGAILNNPNVGIIDILDYASTSKKTTVRTLSGADQNASGGNINFNSGHWTNTNAVTSVTILCSSNYTTASSFALYGIKAAV